MIPMTFEEWQNCITKDCKIILTKDFAQKRLAIYTNRDNSETQKFLSLYGEDHLLNIINFYAKTLDD